MRSLVFLFLTVTLCFSFGLERTLTDYRLKSLLNLKLTQQSLKPIRVKALKDGSVEIVKVNLHELKDVLLSKKFSYVEAPVKLKPQNDIVYSTSYVLYGDPGSVISVYTQTGFWGYIFRDINDVTINGNCYLSSPPNRFVCSDSASFYSNKEYRLVIGGNLDGSYISGYSQIYLTGTMSNKTDRTGRGVVVGIIDSGINFCHPAFLDQNGKTKIKYFGFLSDRPSCDGIYDLTSGVCEYDEAQINAMIGSGNCNHDLMGHGTHVAGTAAGYWFGTIYNGIAKDASLIVYKLTEWTDSDAITGLRWIREKADLLGMPAVVNLSVGTHAGPHDGTSLLEREIDNVSGQGFVVVAAAGNYGSENVHASTTDVKDRIRISVNPGITSVEGWYLQGSEYRVEVCAPGSDNCVGTDPGRDTDGYERIWGTNCSARIFNSITSSPLNGDGNFLIDINCSSGSLLDIKLTALSGSDLRVDMWVVSGSGSFNDHYERDPTGGITFTVTNPGTSRRVITVGAFASRPLDTQSFNNAGRIAYFSSRGPTRDGRIKPNVVAGGYFICSANSEFSSSSDPSLCAGSHYYVPLAGTSMAAPVVTGLIALYLQDHPLATPEEVKEWLSSNAIEDENLPYPNVAYGSGKAVYSPATRYKGSQEDFRTGVEKGYFFVYVSEGGCNSFSPSGLLPILSVLMFLRFLIRRG